VQNLLYDISQTAILDNVDPELVQYPQRWRPTTSAAS